MEILILELSLEESKHLLRCLRMTHASGKDLDVGEMVEDKIVKFIKENEK
jgi:hypothetical protein